MLDKKTVKLSSGREVTLKGLKFFERAELKDQALKKYNENIPVSLVTCGRALIAAGVTEEELETWPDADVYEGGAEVFNMINLSETDKKK